MHCPGAVFDRPEPCSRSRTLPRASAARRKAALSGPVVAEGVTRQAKGRFSGPVVAEGVTRQAKGRFSGPVVAEGVTRQAKSRFLGVVFVSRCDRPAAYASDRNEYLAAQRERSSQAPQQRIRMVSVAFLRAALAYWSHILDGGP